MGFKIFFLSNWKTFTGFCAAVFGLAIILIEIHARVGVYPIVAPITFITTLISWAVAMLSLVFLLGSFLVYLVLSLIGLLHRPKSVV